SYSQIKDELGISKSTLSGWLAPYPLSKKRIRELRDINPKRIENYRNTMARKRQERFDLVYKKVGKDIGKLNKRELLLAGLFLYWGEGMKADRYSTVFTNTDSKMVIYFLRWLDIIKVDKKDITFSLHLYSDMDENKEIKYWLNQ